MRFVMVGVTAPSHIYPGLGVIRELVSRGHELTYVVGDRHGDLVPRSAVARRPGVRTPRA